MQGNAEFEGAESAAARGVSMRFLSVCSGLEGASLAFGPLGWVPVGFAEIEAFPSAIIAARHGSNLPGEALSGNVPPNFGDFTAIELQALGAVDLLVGGTPCQAFSVAGKRLSLADARGNLTLSYAVLAHELARNNGLRNCLWENVPGSLSTPDNAFGCFLGALVGADDALLPCARPQTGKSNVGWAWKPARRDPVLDGDGNETGEFVDRPAEHVARWPVAGMAEGPGARLAWRVLDAQFFGLAQRRERVFVVADFGGGADPTEVLFEPVGLRGNSAPSRETGERVAGPLEASLGRRGGQPNDHDPSGGLIAYGGNNTSGPIDIATACRAKGGSGHGDFESETFVACPVADTLAVGANQTTGFFGDVVAHSLRGEGFDASEDGTGRGPPLVPVAYRTSGNCGAWETGDKTDAPTTGTDPNSHVIAFTSKDYGGDAATDLAPRMRSMGFDESHANGGVMPAIAFQQSSRDELWLPGGDGSIAGAVTAERGSKHQNAVAFDMRGREDGAQFEGPNDTANIRAASGGSSRSYVAQSWAVRRLTPRECERLQGVPDDYTRIAWRGKPADECPDGPRYKALGNSWAVPVVAWIGRRLDAALAREAEK